MKKTPELCRSSDHLLALLQGSLEPHAETDLQTHLDDCLSCRQQLEQIAADPAIWNEASQFLGEEFSNELSFANAANCERDNRLPLQVRQVIETLSPTDDPAMLGRIGGYEVFGVVGAGGMGVVLKAHDRALDRVVAIKVLAPHLANSGSARQRFAREAKAAAAIIHPNVIAIYGVSNEESLPYLVMPFIGGSSLQRRLNTQGALPVAEVLRIGHQIAAGLAAAHSQGLVHRDIKPANIMLDDGVERVSITDFGLARAVDDASMTRTGVIAGTPQFMSPEQARGETMEHRSDLFSLGSVLYTMCTGRSPFRAETSYGVMRRITDDQPTAIREINPDVPAWLSQIIDKLMAKQPENRFESAEEVAVLLEECLAHVQQPTTTPLPESLCVAEPSSSSSSRFPPILKKLLAAAFAFFLILAGVLIVVELNKGKLTIECSADDVPIRVTQGDSIVKKMTVTKSGATIRVAAGTYVVEVDGDFDGISVENGEVLLQRGTTEVVKVTRSEQPSPQRKSRDVSDRVVIPSMSFETPEALMKYAGECQTQENAIGFISCWSNKLAKQFAASYLIASVITLVDFDAFSDSRQPRYAKQLEILSQILGDEFYPDGAGELEALMLANENVADRTSDVFGANTRKSRLTMTLADAAVKHLKDPRSFVIRFATWANQNSNEQPDDKVYNYRIIEQQADTAIAINLTDGDKVGLIKSKTGWQIDNPWLSLDDEKSSQNNSAGPSGTNNLLGSDASVSPTAAIPRLHSFDLDLFRTEEWLGQTAVVDETNLRVIQDFESNTFAAFSKTRRRWSGYSFAPQLSVSPRALGESSDSKKNDFVVGFDYSGGRIKEVVAIDCRGRFCKHELQSPVDHDLKVMLVGNGVLFYIADQTVYAFSGRTGTWDYCIAPHLPDIVWENGVGKVPSAIDTESTEGIVIRRHSVATFLADKGRWEHSDLPVGTKTRVNPVIGAKFDDTEVTKFHAPTTVKPEAQKTNEGLRNNTAAENETPDAREQIKIAKQAAQQFINALQLGQKEELKTYFAKNHDPVLDDKIVMNGYARRLDGKTPKLIKTLRNYQDNNDILFVSSIMQSEHSKSQSFQLLVGVKREQNTCRVSKFVVGTVAETKAITDFFQGHGGVTWGQRNERLILGGLSNKKLLNAELKLRRAEELLTTESELEPPRQEANTAVAQTVLAMQRIQNRYRDIIYMVCSSRGLSEPSLSNSEFSEWLNRYSRTYDWLLDTFELSDREKHKAEFKSLVQRCRRLIDYERDLIFTATHQAGRTEHDLSKLKSQKGRKPTQDMPSFRPELLSSTSITYHETELRAVESELDRVYEQLVDWTPFSNLQKKHAAFLEVLSRLPDDDDIEYFAADYRVTRTNLIGAKLSDVKSADFGDEGKLEKHEKIRWHLPTRRGYIEDDQYSRRKQYHFDGERHLEIIHYEDGLEANIADERSDRYDGVGLLYCDYVLRPFRGLRVENLPEPKISLRELLRGHEKRYGVTTDRQFRIVEDTENLLRIDVVQSNWGNLNPGTTFEVTLDKGMNYAIVSIIQRSNLKEDNRVGVKFQRPTFEGKIERKTFFTDHVQFGDHWIPKRMVTFFDHEGRTNGAEEDENAKETDDPYRHAGVQKAEYVASYLSINKNEDMIELQIPADAKVVDKRKEQGEAVPDEASVAKETGARVKTEPRLATGRLRHTGQSGMLSEGPFVFC